LKLYNQTFYIMRMRFYTALIKGVSDEFILHVDVSRDRFHIECYYFQIIETVTSGPYLQELSFEDSAFQVPLSAAERCKEQFLQLKKFHTS